MNLFKRIKNLWDISNFKVSTNNTLTGASLVPDNAYKPKKKKATIVVIKKYNQALDETS